MSDDKEQIEDDASLANAMIDEAFDGKQAGNANGQGVQFSQGGQFSQGVQFTKEELEAIRKLAPEGTAFADIPIEVSAILGAAELDIANLLKIGRGAVIELDRLLGQPLELRCQNRPIAEGEVVIKENSLLAININQMIGQRPTIDE